MGKDSKSFLTKYTYAFWAGAILTILAWALPFGHWVIYPLSLLATWAHELGHGIAALLAGGRFERLELFAGLGGLAHTAVDSPVARAVVSAGGLVGAPLLGAVIIALGPYRRLDRPILVGLAGALLLSLALWVRNPFGVVACLGLALTLGLGAWRLRPRRRFIAVQLLGIQLALSALRNWQYLFVAEAKVGGRIVPSDVSAIAELLGGHHLLWGAAITLFNLGLLVGAYALTRRRLHREATRDR